MTAPTGTETVLQGTGAGFNRRHSDLFSLGALGPLLTALLVGLPVVTTILIGLFAGGGATWTHITQTFFWTYLSNTALVLAGVSGLVLATAVPTAWLVTVHEFPGRRLFSWLLILPLAAPGYVLAFAYADLLGVAGPVQAALRDMTGLAARDYWFPDLRSASGCAFVLAAALYPYVYLTARAAFTSQSVCTLEAAAALGASPWQRFIRVALPGARPAIFAGLALALMEAAADFGAASFLGVQTLTVGVYRAWSSFSDPAAGARLAILLVGLTLAFQWAERSGRGEAGYAASSTRWRHQTRIKLSPLAGGLACLFCLSIFLWGFGLPVGRLIVRSVEAREVAPPVFGMLTNSVLLAGIGAAAAFLVSIPIAYAAYMKRSFSGFARSVVLSGYAMPGTMLALGGLYLLDALPFGTTGSLALCVLVFIYVSRFAAAGVSSMEAALAKAPDSLRSAARSLGAGRVRRMLEVDLPIIMPGAAAAALILFVEILKELPATLMLRPFNWDTLAVRAYAYASDERLEAAALPSLLITLCGLLPVILLSWRLSSSRPGQVAS